MYFDFRDVFRAARLGLSPKKMWVMFWGLVWSFLLYGVFGYLSHLSSGRSLADVWVMFGLVPAMPWPGSAFWPWALWIIGVLGAMVVLMFSSAMVSRLATEQLKGNEFFEIKEAAAYLKTAWKTILGSPFVIFSFIIMLLIFGIILGWWGRIAVLGELTVALLSVPIYLVCLFLAFLLVTLTIGLFYAPVISGATKGDAFDNLFEIFSSITSQPWRLVLYTGLLKFVSFLAAAIFAWFTLIGLGVAYQILSWAMGAKFTDLAIAAFNMYTPPLATNYVMALGIENPVMSVVSSFMLATPSLNWSGQTAAFVMGMSLNAIRLLVLSYMLSVFITGQTIIYGIIVMKRDQRNIFEKEEEEVAKACQSEDGIKELNEEESPSEEPKVKRVVRKTKSPAKLKKK
jgi:hypothetical protein